MIDLDGERLKRGQRVMIEGEVWCFKHGTVHSDTENPYDSLDDQCSHSDDHRPIAWTARAGDYK